MFRFRIARVINGGDIFSVFSRASPGTRTVRIHRLPSCKYPTPGPARVRVPYAFALPTTRQIKDTRTVPYEPENRTQTTVLVPSKYAVQYYPALNKNHDLQGLQNASLHPRPWQLVNKTPAQERTTKCTTQHTKNTTQYFVRAIS